MATSPKGTTRGTLLCVDCGTRSGLEFIGPPKLQYSRFDTLIGTEYGLSIVTDMFCTNCDKPQKLIVIEDKEGVKFGIATQTESPTFVPVMDWPKQMEADAIAWALELEGKK